MGYVDGNIVGADANESYYSAAYMAQLEESKLPRRCPRAIIVFNKSDLLPPTWSETEALEKLREANSVAVRRLEGLFSGKLAQVLISTADDTRCIETQLLAIESSLPEKLRAQAMLDVKRLSKYRI